MTRSAGSTGLLLLLAAGCGVEPLPVQLSLVLPARLAQSAASFDRPGGELRVFAAEGTTTFPTSGTPAARAGLRWRDAVAVIRLELSPGQYHAEAIYTEQHNGSTTALPLLRQFTATPFRVTAGHFVSVNLYDNASTAFDTDEDGVENLDELLANTDPEDGESFDCATTACRPMRVAGDLPSLVGAGFHAGALFGLVDPGNSQAGHILRTEVTTGVSAVWLTTGRDPFQLQVTAEHVLWMDRGPPGTATPVVSIAWTNPDAPGVPLQISETTISAFVANSQTVFYAYDGVEKTQGIYAARLADAVPRAAALISGAPCASPQMIADEDYLYGIVGIPGGTQLWRLPVDAVDSSDCPRLVGGVSALAHGLTQGATHAYWIEGASILRVLKTGGSAEVVALDETAGEILDLQVDGETLYWTRLARAGTARTLVAQAPDGTQTEIFADETGELHILVADATHIYWRNAAGELWRLGKLRGSAD